MRYGRQGEEWERGSGFERRARLDLRAAARARLFSHLEISSLRVATGKIVVIMYYTLRSAAYASPQPARERIASLHPPPSTPPSP